MRTENDFLLMLLGNQQTLKTFERLSFYLVFKSKQHSIDQRISKHSYTKQFQDLRNQGHFPFNQEFRNFQNEDKWYKCTWIDSRNPEIVEFPKSKPFNRKFRKISK